MLKTKHHRRVQRYEFKRGYQFNKTLGKKWEWYPYVDSNGILHAWKTYCSDHLTLTQLTNLKDLNH